MVRVDKTLRRTTKACMDGWLYVAIFVVLINFAGRTAIDL